MNIHRKQRNLMLGLVLKQILTVMMMIIPIEFILVGILTDVSATHPWKAEAPINNVRMFSNIYCKK